MLLSIWMFMSEEMALGTTPVLMALLLNWPCCYGQRSSLVVAGLSRRVIDIKVTHKYPHAYTIMIGKVNKRQMGVNAKEMDNDNLTR